MKNLFTYGTLMCEEIMVEVSGCRLSHGFGTLKEYERRSVIGEPYPAILPHKESTVEGVVYQNVPDWAFDRLDRFEGEMYERQPVTIEMSHGGTLPAETYVMKEAFSNLLHEADWDFDDFRASAKNN
jgi:gamma-glutamylcyclotransferase (GGCT)/AIG2-like uncharacterized protein YtfP